jgi:hypothetical protein
MMDDFGGVLEVLRGVSCRDLEEGRCLRVTWAQQQLAYIQHRAWKYFNFKCVAFLSELHEYIVPCSVSPRVCTDVSRHLRLSTLGEAECGACPTVLPTKNKKEEQEKWMAGLEA